MKWFFKYSALAVAAAFALGSCTKEETRPSTSENSLHFIINTAENVQLRSFVENNQNGTYTPKWTNGDELAIFIGTISDKTSSPTATLSNTAETGTTASFDGTVPTDLTKGSFLSFSPAGAFAKGYSDGTVGINLSEIQTPSSLTIDEKCDVLVAKPCDFTAENGTVEINDLYFKRIFSIVKVNLKGVEALNGEKVTSFTLSAPATLTGRAATDLSTASISKWNVDNKSVTAIYSGDCPVFGGDNVLKNTIWLVVNPTTVASDSKITFSGETENYTFSKEVTLTKDLVFPQSQMAVINLTINEGNYSEKLKATSYTLVEDASKIADGAEYLIVYNGEVAMGEFNSSNYYGKVSVSAVNKVINITSEAVNVITLEAGATAGQYYMIDSDGKYLYWSSGNTVNRGDKGATDKYLWTIEKDKITNVGETPRRLQYNTSNPRFACYTGSQKDVTLYVNEATLIPSLEKPTTLMASAEGSTVTVLWEAVANAQSYDVTCAGQTKNVTDTEATFSEVAVGTYEVSVVAKASGYKNSANAVTSVIVGKPALDKPVIKTVSETANGFYAELEAAVQYAESYAWDLYEGSVAVGNLVGCGENTTVKFSITINETDFLITALKPETTYYLVITAKAAAYTSSESNPASFTTAADANNGSLEKPFTAAEAITAIDAGGDLTNKYVKGVITEVTDFNSTYGSITYNIESGEKTLMVYSGLDLGKAQFSSKADLKINDEVLVCGTLKKYNSTYEFDKNNYLVTINGSSEVYVGLKVSGQNTTFNVGDEFVFGGTVLQDWRGKDDVNVTSSASFSGYDMNAEGTQTVTVTVGNESTTYKITVKNSSSTGGEIVTLFSESFGNNSSSARAWSDSYKEQGGIKSVYSGSTYTITNAKQSKNTVGKTKSGLAQSTQNQDAIFEIKGLNVAAYSDLSVSYYWKAGSIGKNYSTSLYYSKDGGTTYTEVEKTSGTGATTFVEVTYTLPADAVLSNLCLKVVFNTSNTQAVIDEFVLKGTTN